MAEFITKTLIETTEDIARKHGNYGREEFRRRCAGHHVLPSDYLVQIMCDGFVEGGPSYEVRFFGRLIGFDGSKCVLYVTSGDFAGMLARTRDGRVLYSLTERSERIARRVGDPEARAHWLAVARRNRAVLERLSPLPPSEISKRDSMRGRLILGAGDRKVKYFA